MRGLDILMLRAPGAVTRALTVKCPLPSCRAEPGTACGIYLGKPEVHDQREAVAYHAPMSKT